MVTPIRQSSDISIHALREEGDRAEQASLCRSKRFLSTPSARRATLASPRTTLILCYFYPRPPRGGRPCCPYSANPEELFLSTPSARRATTLLSQGKVEPPDISIHALREEGDYSPFNGANDLRYFYPRPPRGGRQPGLANRCSLQCISIHALREEGDAASHQNQTALLISIHALREEGDCCHVSDLLWRF